jgi:hypothetical protein
LALPVLILIVLNPLMVEVVKDMYPRIKAALYSAYGKLRQQTPSGIAYPLVVAVESESRTISYRIPEGLSEDALQLAVTTIAEHFSRDAKEPIPAFFFDPATHTWIESSDGEISFPIDQPLDAGVAGARGSPGEKKRKRVRVRWLLIGGLVAAALVIGVGIGAVVFKSDSKTLSESPAVIASSTTTTSYSPELTRTEAAAILESKVNFLLRSYYFATPDPVSGLGGGGFHSDTDPFGLTVVENCSATDFNELTHAWIVACDAHYEYKNGRVERDADKKTYRLFDDTGEWEFIN